SDAMAMELVGAKFRIGRPDPQRAMVAEISGGDVGLRLIVGHRLRIADLRHQPGVKLFRRRVVVYVDDDMIDSRAHNDTSCSQLNARPNSLNKAARITPAGGATRLNNLNASSPWFTSIPAPSVARRPAASAGFRNAVGSRE